MRQLAGEEISDIAGTSILRIQCLLGKLRAKVVLVGSNLEGLGRDSPCMLATVKSLARLLVEVVVLQGRKLDPASPTGKLMLAAAAEVERDLLVGRTRTGLT